MPILIKKNIFYSSLIIYLILSNSFVNSQTVQPQPKPLYIGAGIAYYLSANGHGPFYEAYISASKGKHFFGVGPVMQERGYNLCGGRISYSYLLGSRDDDFDFGESKSEKSISFLSVSIISYLQYVNQIPLSYGKVLIENKLDTVPGRDWNKINFSTIETCVGLEVIMRITKRIRFKNFFAVGAYYHLNSVPGMYEDKANAIVSFGTSISLTSFKK